jgi:hypothetical protein
MWGRWLGAPSRVLLCTMGLLSVDTEAHPEHFVQIQSGAQSRTARHVQQRARQSPAPAAWDRAARHAPSHSDFDFFGGAGPGARQPEVALIGWPTLEAPPSFPAFLSASLHELMRWHSPLSSEIRSIGSLLQAQSHCLGPRFPASFSRSQTPRTTVSLFSAQAARFLGSLSRLVVPLSTS